MIDVPLCAVCQRQLRRKSGEEERLLKFGRLSAVLTFILVMALVVLIAPDGILFSLRLLAGLLSALVITAVLLSFFRRARRNVLLPEQRSVYASAGIAEFTWRATVFEFTNEAFAEQFRKLNEALLMEM